MDVNPIREVEELLRDIWQQQGCIWPGPQVPPVTPYRTCALCQRHRDITELTDFTGDSCQFCHSGS